MNNAHAQISSAQVLRPDTQVVKTYLIESHDQKAIDMLLDTEHSSLQKSILGSGYQVSLSPSADDSDLVTLESHHKGEHVTLFIDYSNPRYWLAHTVSRSDHADRFIQALLNAVSSLDRAWFPTGFLRSAAKLGQFQGLHLQFDRRFLRTDDDSVQYLKMALWGNKAAEVLDLLSSKTAFPRETSLSRVALRFSLKEDEDNFSITNVWHHGKLTARGTSFDAHAALTADLIARYASHVALIEDRYSIAYTSTNDLRRIDGNRLVFRFSRPINDIHLFASRVFSCARPFRFLGVVRERSDDLLLISAVDLHIGRTVFFEVRPLEVSLFLPRGACGNTVLRFYTNLQHHVDATVEVWGGNGESVFEF